MKQVTHWTKHRYWLMMLCMLLVTLHVAVPRTFSAALFAPSEDCGFCHTTDFGALVDSAGNALSMYDDWASTMMGNSFRDPLFRAKLESEILRNKHLADVIEDKCLTCHTPMAHTQQHHDKAGRYSLAQAKDDEPALDGVSCTLCHQILPDKLGEVESFSGNYVINDKRMIFGPYREVFPRPMLNHVGYLPTFGDQVHKASLCGSCHTLFTPYVDNKGEVAGQFPEQTPYLEWLNSSYANESSARTCQECHMPRIDEPIKITNRPPWFTATQSPFWKHHFTGGNTTMLNMMLDNLDQIGLTATESQLRTTIQRTEERLSQETVEISFMEMRRTGSNLHLKIKMVNKTGHKFPSGFPSRRAWLRLQVHDATGKPVFQSGSWTETGNIIGIDDGFEPHHDVITSGDQVLIFQAVPGDVDGKPTYTLLRASTYLKDNRLLPAGYKSSGPFAEYTRTAGRALADVNFNQDSEHGEGTGSDIVTYDITLHQPLYPLAVKLELLYQTVSPRFIEDLGNDVTPAVSDFLRMYSSLNPDPVVITTKSLVVQQ